MADRRDFLRGAATTVGASIAAKWRLNPETEEIEINKMSGDMLIGDTPEYINMLVESHNRLLRRVRELERNR